MQKPEDNTQERIDGIVGVYIFESYFNAMKKMKSATKKWKLFEAIFNYDCYDEVLEMDDDVKSYFDIIAPIIKSRRTKKSTKVVQNSSKNEPKLIQNSSKTESKLIQNSSKTEPKLNQNCIKNGKVLYENLDESNPQNCLKGKGEVVGEEKEKLQKNKRTKNASINTITNTITNTNTTNNCVKDGFGANGDCDGDGGGGNNCAEEVSFLPRTKVAECALAKPASKKVCTSFSVKPPTLEEVKSFVEEQELSFDPERFFYYYEARGWKTGRTKISSWQSCAHIWHIKELKDIKEREQKRKLTSIDRCKYKTNKCNAGDKGIASNTGGEFGKIRKFNSSFLSLDQVACEFGENLGPDNNASARVGEALCN